MNNTIMQAARELEQQVVSDANEIMQMAGKEHVRFLDAQYDPTVTEAQGAEAMAKLKSLADDVAALKAKHGIV